MIHQRRGYYYRQHIYPKYRSTQMHTANINRHKGRNWWEYIVGAFNMDRYSRQKINKATEILKETIEKLDLIDSFRTWHPTKSEYSFFSSTHGTFSRINHILGHKTNLNKFKSMEIISSIFSDHNGMKLEINHRKWNEKKPTTWRQETCY